MEEANVISDQAGQDDGEIGQTSEEEEAQGSEPSTRKCWDWLDGYCEFTSDFEPPMVFNRWCGLVALAAALGRKVWLQEANARIYPNLFVVLVAPSGVGKTSAMREALPFIEEAKVSRSAAKPSASKFLKSMSEALRHEEGIGPITPYLLWAEELPSFLGPDAYRSGMLADLTTLYDCPDEWTKETHIRQQEVITGAYLVMCGGSTAEGLFDVMPSGSVMQGFTARIMFVHSLHNEKRVTEKPWGKRQQKLFEPLKADMRVIAQLRGPARLSDTARVLWNDYYMYRPHAQDEFTDVRLQGYASRKPFYAKKLALLLAVSEDDRLSVEAHHLEKAFRLLDEMDRTLYMVYEDIAPSVAMQNYAKIIRRMQKRPGGELLRTDLMRAYAYVMDGMELDKAMSYLQGMGLIDTVTLVSRQGRPTTIYRLTEVGKKWNKGRK